MGLVRLTLLLFITLLMFI